MSIGHLLWSFDGRIRRSHFWLGVLIVVIMSMILGMFAKAIGVPVEHLHEHHAQVEHVGFIGALIMLCGSLAILWAHIAIVAKRFHDRGKSALWVLISFVPVLGFFWILIECGMLAGDPGANAYGPPDYGGAVLA